MEQGHGEEEPGRGAGGKAPRERLHKRPPSDAARQRGDAIGRGSSSNGGFFALLRSPIQAAVHTVRQWSSPRESRDQAQTESAGGEATHAVPLQAASEPQQLQQQHQNQPVNLQQASQQQRQHQQQSARHDPPQPQQVMARANEVLSNTLQVVAPPLKAPDPQTIVAQKRDEGWSPSKVDSLKYFLNKSTDASAAKPSTDLVEPSAGTQAARPYLGLKYLLRTGPVGSDMPRTWQAMHGGAQQALPMPPSTGARRYAPYALPPAGAGRFRSDLRERQQEHAASQLRVHGHGPLPLTPYPHAQLKAAAAAGHLQQPAVMPRLPGPAVVPLLPPSAGAAAGLRSGAGAGASTSGAETNMQLVLAGSTPGPAPRSSLMGGTASGLGNAQTPMPRKLFQGSGLGSAFGTPLSGAAGAAGRSGVKRGWDSSHATPLLQSGSGIKRLTEAKRQRMRYTSETRSVLSIGAASQAPGSASPQDGTPGSESDHATPTPAATPATTRPAPATTETARRILQSLDNTRKMGGPPATPGSEIPLGKPGPAGSTPFPRSTAPPPPLDRLSPLQLASQSAASKQPLALPPPSPVEAAFSPLVAPTVLFPDAPTPSASEAAPSTKAAAAPESTFSFQPQRQPPSQAAPAYSPAPTLAQAPQEPAPSVSFSLPPRTAETTQLFGSAPKVNGVPAWGMGAGAGASAKAAAAEPSRMYVFGAGRKDDVSEAVASALQAVQPAADAAVPVFAFGTGKVGPAKADGFGSAFPSMPAHGTPSRTPDPAMHRKLVEQVAAAAAIPLPEDDAEEEAQAQLPASTTKASLTDTFSTPAPTSGGWGSDFLAANKAAFTASTEAVAKEVEAAKQGGAAAPSPAPAVASGGGWGSAFLAQNQAALSAANDAVVKEVEAAKQPSATPASSPAAAGGWDMSFLQKNQAQLSSASDAVAKEVEAAKASAAPAAGFSFGLPSAAASKPSETAPSGAGGAAAAVPSTAGAADGAAAGAGAAQTPAASGGGGWDTAFLQKSQAALSSASTAVAKEIEAAKTPAAADSASPAPAFAFGSPFTPAKTTPVAGLGAPSGMVFGGASTAAPTDGAAAPATTGQAAAPAATLFGTAAPATASSAPAFSFGGAGFGSGAAPAVSAAAPAFGGAASAPGFSFGASAGDAAAQPSASASPAFGGFTAASAGASASSPSLFTFGGGAASAAAPAAAAASPVFGTTSASPSFTFGGAEAQQQPAAAFPSFGAAPASSPAFGAATAPAPTASAPSSFGFAFGAAPAAEASKPAQLAGGFGSGAGAPFGSAASGAPFGQQQPSPAAPSSFTFGQAAPAASSPNFIFGAAPAASPAPAPTWGAPQAAAPAPFGQGGAAPFAFSSAPQSAPQVFGGGPSPAPFGQQAAPQQQPGSFAFGAQGGFGAAPAPAPAFGAAPAQGFGMGAPAPGADAGGGGGFTMGAGEQPNARRRLRGKRHGQ